MAKGKPYTREFRENAVRLSMTPGKTIAAVARELGLSLNTLHDWRRQHRERSAPPSASDQESLEQQNRRLARENELLREEAAILKKAIAYFAQPPKK